MNDLIDKKTKPEGAPDYQSAIWSLFDNKIAYFLKYNIVDIFLYLCSNLLYSFVFWKTLLLFPVLFIFYLKQLKNYCLVFSF